MMRMQELATTTALTTGTTATTATTARTTRTTTTRAGMAQADTPRRGGGGRTAVACRRCHARKAKCNATVAAAAGTAAGASTTPLVPCSSCVAAGLECVLIESRRGKYPRRRRGAEDRRRSEVVAASVLSSGLLAAAAAAAAAAPSADDAHAVATTLSPASAPAMTGAGDALPATPDSPDAFYAQIADQGLNNGDDTATVMGDGASTGSAATPGAAPSSAVMAAMANGGDCSATANMHNTAAGGSAGATHGGPNLPLPVIETVFLGEAFSLTYMLHDVLAPFLAADAHRFQRRQHLPLLTNRPTCPRADVVARQAAYLRSEGLGGPDMFAGAGAEEEHENRHGNDSPDDADDPLLRCYFDHFHPAFPVVHAAQFRAAVAARTASLLVLTAVRLVAVTICADALLVEAARSSGVACDAADKTAGSPGKASLQIRHVLRRRYYRQAKALYDADLEPDKYDTIAGAFLMSFWWDGPDDQKDSWHWLGVATSLAQSRGMHRS